MMMTLNVAEYDNEAANYDKSRFEDRMGRHLDLMHKRILGGLINPAGRRVLEAAIGTGRFGTWLATKGFEVVGFDLSREMLKKAKEKSEVLKVDVGLVLADVHFLPFRQGLFDSCICVNAVDHFSDIDGFLREVSHALKFEGSFIFNFSNLQSPYLPVAMVVNSRNQALFKGSTISSRWHTLREIKDMVSKNGFDVDGLRGCFIASPVPFGNFLFRIIRVINLSAENSQLKLLAGSPFVKAKLTRHFQQLH